MRLRPLALPLTAAVLTVSSVRPAAATVPAEGQTTVLQSYRLPDSAAADGKLDEWAGVPGYGSDRYFRRFDKPEPIPPEAGFRPTLYAGRKAGSPDLFFLILIEDPFVYSEEAGGWVYGDCAELFLDFGRERRDRENPDWRQDPGKLKYPEMGQFGFRPRDALGGDKLFRAGFTPPAWQVKYVSVPVEGGIAFEIQVDGKSILAEQKLDALPAVIGLDIGLVNVNWPVILQGAGWNNTAGIFRMFGDWSVIAHPATYGGLATGAIDSPALDGKYLPPARTLPSLYGPAPDLAAIREHLATLPPEKLADLVYWAGCTGARLTPALVEQLIGKGSPRLCEAVLTVLRAPAQDAAARLAGVRLAYGNTAGQTPRGLALANVLNEAYELGFASALAELTAHPDLTVAVTAASALAVVGTPAELPRFEATFAARAAAPASAGAVPFSAARPFLEPSLSMLRFRAHPPPLPQNAPRRAPEPRNTDLARVFPNDNNNLYNGADLARTWPAAGPRELWRAEVGAGMGAVIEAGGRAFALSVLTTETDDGKGGKKKSQRQVAWCFRATDGTLLWQTTLLETGAPYQAASPVADGDFLFVAPEGALLCLSAADGSEVWREEKAFTGPPFASPLVVGDTLYVPGKALTAVDKASGQVLWQTPGPAVSPGSPAWQELDGVAQLVLPVGSGGTAEVWGVSAADGRVFWKHPVRCTFGLCSSPVVDGSRVLLSSGQTGEEFFTALQMFVTTAPAPAPGEPLHAGRVIRALPAYTRRDTQANYANTAAVVDWRVYGMSSVALDCTEAASGRLLWRGQADGWRYSGHVLAADGLLLGQSGGWLILAEAAADGYRELGRHKLDADLANGQQQPTLANGRLYVRGKSTIACFDVAAPRP